MKFLKRLGQRQINERVTIYVALLAALPNLPMLAVRIVQQNWLFVLIDSIMIIGCLLVVYFVYNRRHIMLMQFILSTLLMAALTLIVIYGNANHLFWFFPGVISFFFILKPKAALLYSAISMLLTLPVIIEFDTETVMIFYTAMLPMVLFAYFAVNEVRLQNADLHTLATEDFLTQTGNRRAFQHDATLSVDAFVRHKIPCCLLLLDMDHFKILNDTHGHATGDKVLIDTSRLIKQRLRRSDRLYRIGGEEFAIILNHCALKEAVSVSHDIVAYVKKHQDAELPATTLSIGLAQLKLAETIDELMARTDKALYASKEKGRDRVTTAH